MRRSTYLLAALIAVAFAGNAHAAYIDPAAGSMILQIIIGGVVSAYVSLKLFKRRIVEFFNRRKQ